MAAIVRAASCCVGQSKNLTSSGFRGHDMLGIGSSMRAGHSTIWYEQAGFDVWQVALGLETVKGPAFDWALRLRANHSTAVTVGVSTPTVLTKDGAQVHKAEYLEARELIVAGLRAPRPPAIEPETAISERGLAAAGSSSLAGVTPSDVAQLSLAPPGGSERRSTGSGSLLSPICFGVDGSPPASALAAAVSKACESVPSATVTRKRMVSRKAVPTPHTREVMCWVDESGDGYQLGARCIDRGPDETAQDAFGRWLWEVRGLVCGEDEEPSQALERNARARFDVTRFKLRERGLLAAHQLALFRQLLAGVLSCAGRDATLTGANR